MGADLSGVAGTVDPTVLENSDRIAGESSKFNKSTHVNGRGWTVALGCLATVVACVAGLAAVSFAVAALAPVYIIVAAAVCVGSAVVAAVALGAGLVRTNQNNSATL